MAGKVSTNRMRQLFTRRCLCCGSPVRDASICCDDCGCDFAERPPRSYAEMEGLIGEPMNTFDDTLTGMHDQPDRSARLVERWLLFIFLSMMMLVAIAMLASAAMQPVR